LFWVCCYKEIVVRDRPGFVPESNIMRRGRYGIIDKEREGAWFEDYEVTD